MRSGRLRNKIRVEQRTRVPDGGGGFEQGWETFQDNLSARIVTTSGRESATTDALAGVNTQEIFVRASTKTRPITNLMRIVNVRSGEVHDIKSVWPDERNKVIKILTQSGSRSE